MSEDQQNSSGNNGERQPVEVRIQLSPDGQIQVSAPGNGELFDEPMSFWLLDKAKDFIKSRNAQIINKKGPKLLVPTRFRRR